MYESASFFHTPNQYSMSANFNICYLVDENAQLFKEFSDPFCLYCSSVALVLLPRSFSLSLFVHHLVVSFEILDCLKSFIGKHAYRKDDLEESKAKDICGKLNSKIMKKQQIIPKC